MSTRVLGLGPSFRRAAIAPKFLRNSSALRGALQRRAIQTQSVTPEAEMGILNKQRLLRPSSPHFTIYQPQLTWVGSIAHRFTGVGLSVLLYGFSLGYLFSPETFSSANVVEFVASLPDYVKYSAKFILAAPFSYHAFNGLRHLAWDMGKFLTVRGCYATGYAVLGATAVSTIALVLM